jgi:hypothetical protein
LFDWSRYFNIRRNFSYFTPFSKVVYFFVILWLYQVCMFYYMINGLCFSSIFNSIYTLVWKWLIIVVHIYLF